MPARTKKVSFFEAALWFAFLIGGGFILKWLIDG